MTFAQARDAIVERLEQHLDCKDRIVLSDDIADMPDFPYCCYSTLAPRISTHAFGLVEIPKPENEEDGLTRIRSEPVDATMSFTFCGKTRTVKGRDICGDDEALDMAEKAYGFFLLNGHSIVTENGDIVIRNIGHVANRTGFHVTEPIRRYGFDVRFGYIRTDEMPTVTIKKPGEPDWKSPVINKK